MQQRNNQHILNETKLSCQPTFSKINNKQMGKYKIKNNQMGLQKIKNKQRGRHKIKNKQTGYAQNADT